MDETAVVSSWRHTDGHWPGRDAHLRRTIDGARRMWPLLHHWEERIHEATDLLPEELATGDWFPSLEARPSGVTVLTRPAPPRRPLTRLWTLPEADPRTHPEVKGPDLLLQGDLRRRAQREGADEAALCDAAGHLVEGGFGTLVWWEDHHLVLPPPGGAPAVGHRAAPVHPG